MGNSVELRPVAEADLPLMERLTSDPASAGEFAYAGYHDLRRWRRAWAENELIGPDGGAFAVRHGTERLGFVNWRRTYVGPAAWFWEIGIAMLPEARGQGHGTQAQRLLVRYLLAHTPVHRIQATTEAGNLAEQRSLEKAGFTREGVSRGIGWRDGAWRDGVTYSLLRTDPAP